MKRIDLHTHSTASDGSQTPSQVMAAAKAAGLSAAALTDHDTLDGLPEAMAAARALNIECIPGIELSAFYQNQEVHIVGLLLDPKEPLLQKRLAHFRQMRSDRNRKMIEKMKAAGVDITEDKLRDLEGDAVITRANFARYLLHIGYIRSINEAFDKYLSPGMAFYVPKTTVTPEEAIAAIREAGGIAILAHPLTYDFSNSRLDECIMSLKTAGLQGIEVYYGTYTSADERNMRRLADRHQLLYAGGSDYHGSVKPHIQIGSGTGHMVIPGDVLRDLRAHAASTNRMG